jgi:hypothetical protein
MFHVEQLLRRLSAGTSRLLVRIPGLKLRPRRTCLGAGPLPADAPPTERSALLKGRSGTLVIWRAGAPNSVRGLRVPPASCYSRQISRLNHDLGGAPRGTAIIPASPFRQVCPSDLRYRLVPSPNAQHIQPYSLWRKVMVSRETAHRSSEQAATGTSRRSTSVSAQ